MDEERRREGEGNFFCWGVEVKNVEERRKYTEGGHSRNKT